MRRVVTPAIPPSMYRHFAVVTLVLTLGLALFAEGESHDALAVEAETRRPAQPRQPAQFAASTSARDAASSARAFARDMSADFDNSFGRPMERLVGGNSTGIIPDENATEAGYSAEYLASLNPVERELLLRQLRESGLPRPAAPAR